MLYYLIQNFKNSVFSTTMALLNDLRNEQSEMPGIRYK